MDSENNQIAVKHFPEQQRFEIRRDDAVAYLTYSDDDGRISLDHTYVPPAWRGQGVAAELVRAAVEEARRRNWKLVPRCSYVVTFFQRHPEMTDVIATS